MCVSSQNWKPEKGRQEKRLSFSSGLSCTPCDFRTSGFRASVVMEFQQMLVVVCDGTDKNHPAQSSCLCSSVLDATTLLSCCQSSVVCVMCSRLLCPYLVCFLSSLSVIMSLSLSSRVCLIIYDLPVYISPVF